MQLPTRKGPRKFTDDGGAFHLTAEAAKRLERQLHELEAQVFDAAEEKARAAALGDRSENAEYQDAKAKLSRLNGRILSIKDRLSRASIIEKGSADGLADIGANVTIEIEGRPETRKSYDIVGAFETDPSRGRISNKSPLGSALIGHGAGETIRMKTPAGETAYRIISVK